MASDAPQLNEKDLKQWDLIQDFRSRVEKLVEKKPAHPSWKDPRRQLQQVDYLCLFLLALVNPALRTMRSICAASQMKRVQEAVCRRSVALGSFSETQHLLQPELLENLMASLSQEVKGPAPKDPRQAWQVWMARDSSIFQATERMVWAQHGAGKAGRRNNAVRLHVSFHLWDDKPGRVAVTAGKVCERKAWKEQLEPGATYVGDRYFAQDYKLFGLLQEKGCWFVLRLRDEAVATVQTENPVTEQDKQTGIERDQGVQLGCKPCYHTGSWRMLTIRKDSGILMRLLTNIPPEQMNAREIQTLYRRRWQIECFFRWLKCLLGCEHWRAQSQTGATVQLYLAMIAGLILQRVLGQRPNQRLWECLQLYLLGWATLDELMSAAEKALVKKS